MRLLIDAGHRNNNYDFGATSGNYKESAIALSIAKKIEKNLTGRNIVCYMSRYTENDVVSLTDRVKKANILNVDLYLSIHVNSATNVEATGIEVLTYTKNDFAQNMCNAICNSTGAINRGQKERKDLAVLNSTKMTALLVECGFLSNNIERAKLLNNTYQEKIAQAICDSIVSQYKITTDIDTEYKKAVDVLVANKVIASPLAWQKDNINIKYVPQLIINMANKLRG